MKFAWLFLMLVILLGCAPTVVDTKPKKLDHKYIVSTEDYDQYTA